MYFITTKRMLEVCFSVHPNIQYRTFFCFLPLSGLLISQNAARHALGEILSG